MYNYSPRKTERESERERERMGQRIIGRDNN